MDPAPVHDPSAVGNPLRRVMISADDKDLQPPSDKFIEEVVKQIDRLDRGNSLVVDIPGNQHCVRLLCLYQFNDSIKYIFLILDHGKTVDTFPQMQIRKVEKLHPASLPPNDKQDPAARYFLQPDPLSINARYCMHYRKVMSASLQISTCSSSR